VQQYNFVLFLSFFFIIFYYHYCISNNLICVYNRPMILQVKDYLLVSIIVEKTRVSHGSKVYLYCNIIKSYIFLSPMFSSNSWADTSKYSS